MHREVTKSVLDYHFACHESKNNGCQIWGWGSVGQNSVGNKMCLSLGESEIIQSTNEVMEERHCMGTQLLWSCTTRDAATTRTASFMRARPPITPQVPHSLLTFGAHCLPHILNAKIFYQRPGMLGLTTKNVLIFPNSP